MRYVGTRNTAELSHSVLTNGRILTICVDLGMGLCLKQLRFKKLSAFLQFSPDYSELYYSEPYKASLGTEIGHQSPLL